ncbi:Txe/YoeB family addiction module toxin [Acetobacterium fimetarium]|uniref:Endoribonuclease YoeB n=1 Tax=Acetobacterium fimetarium TaxID=52691 RepID=A0ABR6WRT0_9FIRM|nr:Txe/YoeB family addiction module toxin [Acetobacterium fimetarium]MBC3803344.1 Txe/YoeB family addiction module toxin [Acetobacterium fimetarium]
MVDNYQIIILKSALKDKEKIKAIPALKKNVDKLIEVLKTDPFKNPPPYEKLSGNFKMFYSRRINRQHRLVYKIQKDDKIVIIVSMWTHYSF